MVYRDFKHYSEILSTFLTYYFKFVLIYQKSYFFWSKLFHTFKTTEWSKLIQILNFCKIFDPGVSLYEHEIIMILLANGIFSRRLPPLSFFHQYIAIKKSLFASLGM